jgi:EAL domain-containing protein (putative c-di-GMP-specific phosphodiesterase class I)
MLHRFADARVIVVDDNPANVSALVAVLGDAGLRNIACATNPRAGLDLARVTDPDVILLDLHMPGLDGYGVLEQLASTSGGNGHFPVVVVMGDTTPDTLHRALSLGARDFIATPLDPIEVVLRVRNMLENRFLHNALQDQNVALIDELDEMKLDDERIQRERHGHLARIQQVLAQDSSLAMVFQPIVDVTDRSIVGLEALSRFAGKPMRSPNLWFEEAAAVGLGPTLEMKAISAALAQAARLPDEAFLAVNVSPELLLSGKLDYLTDDPICPRLVFELTEHVVVDDYGPIRSRIARFREKGVRIAIDDTGAGYSSMRHILLLQPEIIKLDQSLTHGVDHDPARRALASSLVSFAKDIGSDLIAEGVETAEELQTLTCLGAQWVQGFHIARPEPLEALAV